MFNTCLLLYHGHTTIPLGLLNLDARCVPVIIFSNLAVCTNCSTNSGLHHGYIAHIIVNLKRIPSGHTAICQTMNKCFGPYTHVLKLRMVPLDLGGFHAILPPGSLHSYADPRLRLNGQNCDLVDWRPRYLVGFTTPVDPGKICHLGRIHWTCATATTYLLDLIPPHVGSFSPVHVVVVIWIYCLLLPLICITHGFIIVGIAIFDRSLPSCVLSVMGLIAPTLRSPHPDQYNGLCRTDDIGSEDWDHNRHRHSQDNSDACLDTVLSLCKTSCTINIISVGPCSVYKILGHSIGSRKLDFYTCTGLKITTLNLISAPPWVKNFVDRLIWVLIHPFV
jgi:hypothetical protein